MTKSLLIDPLLVRRLIGVALAFIPLFLGSMGYLTTGQLQPSLSAYVHTSQAAWFVGLLFAAGALLVTYRGYDALDRRTSAWAAAACFLVAIVPVAPASATVGQTAGGLLHGAAALVLFAALARFSWRLFPLARTYPSSDDYEAKLTRNRVYKTCGAVTALAALGVLACSASGWGDHCQAVFWLEAAGLWAAAFSWYIKGEGVKALNDNA